MKVSEKMVRAAAEAWHEGVPPWTVDHKAIRRAVEAAIAAAEPMEVLASHELLEARLRRAEDALRYLLSDSYRHRDALGAFEGTGG